MAIQNNEWKFKGKTLQEYLKWRYPTKEDREEETGISIPEISQRRKDVSIESLLEGGELDLSGFKNLEILRLDMGNPGSQTLLSNSITCLNLNGCANLAKLECSGHSLTSVDFLNQLPNPKKLERLLIVDNKIKPTDIEIFSKFVNLRLLEIGTTKIGLEKTKRNQFYGSFKSWKNLTKLERVDIEATDVNEGLEYLFWDIVKELSRAKILKINCSPHSTDAKCASIQNELCLFNYLPLIWQLFNPHLVYQAQPELFKQSEVRDEWLKAIDKSIIKTGEKIDKILNDSPENKKEEVKRLEGKIRELKLIKEIMEGHSILEETLRVGERWNKKTREELKKENEELKKKLEKEEKIMELLPK